MRADWKLHTSSILALNSRVTFGLGRHGLHVQWGREKNDHNAISRAPRLILFNLPFYNNHKITPRSPRRPGQHYSPYTRTKIVTEYNLGQTRRTLFAKYSVPEGSITGLVARYEA